MVPCIQMKPFMMRARLEKDPNKSDSVAVYHMSWGERERKRQIEIEIFNNDGPSTSRFRLTIIFVKNTKINHDVKVLTK